MRTPAPRALITAAAALALAPQAHGEARSYFGLDAMFWSFDPDHLESAEATGLRLRSGARVNDYFGIELQLGTGGSDTIAGERVELDHLLGGYAKGYVPVGGHMNLYGLAGITHARATFSAYGYSVTESETGLTLGGGLEFRVSDQFYVGGDYMHYLDEDYYTFGAVSIGGRWEFGG